LNYNCSNKTKNKFELEYQGYYIELTFELSRTLSSTSFRSIPSLVAMISNKCRCRSSRLARFCSRSSRKRC